METSLQTISKKIIALPGRPLFMLDRDVAELYETETRAINQAVRRNPNRFPEDFCFELTGGELNQLVTDCDRFKTLKHSSVLPFAFTQEGCNMLCAVLSTPIAIQRSIQIMRAFSAMERGRFGAPDAAPSPLLPNGWQMCELRLTYGPEGAQRILKDVFGIGLDVYRREITPYETHVISVNNPNVGHRNHMIFELAERGVSKERLAQVSGISRQSISAIYKKVRHLRSLAKKG